MPIFQYEALSANGGRIEGEMMAQSANAVIEHLQALGHFPTSVDEGRGVRVRFAHPKNERLTARQMASLTRKLAALLAADLPLDRALHILAGVAEADAAKAVVSAVLDRVRDGAALADAMAEHPRAFPPLYTTLVRAGEAGAALPAVMDRLASLLERSLSVRESVKSALIYPGILLSVVLLSLVLVFTVVLPAFEPLFASVGEALPLPTRIVAAVGEFSVQFGPIAVAVLAATGLGLRHQLRHPALRLKWDAIRLRLPLMGNLVITFETAQLSRTLSALLRAGLPLPAALATAQESIGNSAVRQVLAGVHQSLTAGQGLSKPLARAKLFPALAIDMIQVGEETGQLPDLLAKVADMHDAEFRQGIDRLLAILVPTLTLSLGLLVAGVIGSVLLAVLSVNELAF